MTAPFKPPIAMPQIGYDAGEVDYRRSFWKTIGAAATMAGVSAAIALAIALVDWPTIVGSQLFGRLVMVLAMLPVVAVFGWAALVLVGGLIAIHRDRLEAQGRPYAARLPREGRATSVGTLVRSIARVGGDASSLQLRAGEVVEVRTLPEILATLDESGTLDGLPFMPEMAAYCGQRMKVFRRVDKLNDWINGSGLRRLRGMVQLEGFRCPGTAHGGCQANCQPRWSEAWLRRRGATSRASHGTASPARLTAADLLRFAQREGTDGQMAYMCQATELTKGSTPLAWNDPRHYLRDLTSGNIRVRPWTTGVSIACFNWVQKKRRGVTFPYLAPSTSKSSPTESLGLRPGELVRVRSKDQIAATLNARNRNRGLWFDREMLRFCGGEFRVSAVLERVMVEKTGALRELTTPCIVLEGVKATGEYLGFNPEDEHIFWREIWLERVNTTSQP